MNQRFPERIAILRALPGLGDFLCLIPALRSLRFAFPKAEIVLIGLASLEPLVQRFPHYLDRLIPFPGYPGLPEQPPQWREFSNFLLTVQGQHFHLALQMQGNGVITNPLLGLLGAEETAGFYLPGQYCPDSQRFLPWDDTESEVRRYLRLLHHLQIAPQGEALEFPVQVSEQRSRYQLTMAHNLKLDQVVCLHPGASLAERRWSTQNFAQVGDALVDRGYQVVLTGSEAERGLTGAIAVAMHYPVVNLAGKTDLGTLAALFQSCRLLVCNDTGVSHLAAALGLASVVIFTASDPRRWAPLDRDRHRIVTATTMSSVTVATVLAQVDALLSPETAYVTA